MILLFFIGSCIGSFINVIIDRYMIKKDFIFSRSECDYCYHQLSFIDMIPIISYILLKGKCRYCHNTINFRNTFIEIISGFFFVYFILVDQLYLFFLVELLLIIAYIDLKYMIIPDLFLFWIFMLSLFDLNYIDSKILGALSISSLLLVMNLIKKDSFGGGDIKLFLVIGFILGIDQVIMVFYISVILTSLFCIISKYKKQYIPYGPFIVVAVIIVLLK